MNKKFAIISLIFITTSMTLLNCNSSTTSATTATDCKSIKVTTTPDLDENDIEDSSNNALESNNDKSIKSISIASTQNKKTAKKQENKSELKVSNDTDKENNSIIYMSQAGFSITFPSNWKDKYTIEENSNELCVSFKSNDPENKDFNSWMISIRKSDKNDIPCFGLAVGNVQNFNANGNHYIVFMPNDLTLDCRRSDYNEYINMMAECESVINSITTIK